MSLIYQYKLWMTNGANLPQAFQPRICFLQSPLFWTRFFSYTAIRKRCVNMLKATNWLKETNAVKKTCSFPCLSHSSAQLCFCVQFSCSLTNSALLFLLCRFSYHHRIISSPLTNNIAICVGFYYHILLANDGLSEIKQVFRGYRVFGVSKREHIKTRLLYLAPLVTPPFSPHT